MPTFHIRFECTLTAAQEIHKKIMSLNFSNCHARICQVDCQSSVGGSVVVQVNTSSSLYPTAVSVKFVALVLTYLLPVTFLTQYKNIVNV